MKFSGIDYVILFVDDLMRSKRFYSQACGLEVKYEAAHFVQFETGATRFGLYTREAMAELLGTRVVAPQPGGDGFEIGFKVDDCDDAYSQMLAAGAAAAAEPVTRSWGQRTAYVRDPDGYLIELAQDQAS